MLLFLLLLPLKPLLLLLLLLLLPLQLLPVALLLPGVLDTTSPSSAGNTRNATYTRNTMGAMHAAPTAAPRRHVAAAAAHDTRRAAAAEAAEAALDRRRQLLPVDVRGLLRAPHRGAAGHWRKQPPCSSRQPARQRAWLCPSRQPAHSTQRGQAQAHCRRRRGGGGGGGGRGGGAARRRGQGLRGRSVGARLMRCVPRHEAGIRDKPGGG